MKRQASVLVVGGVAAVLALALVLPAVAGWRDGTDPLGGQSGEAAGAGMARERASAFLTENGYVSLATGDVIEFSNHFYVQVVDAETGVGALELIVARDGAFVHPAHGPAMHWNVDYGLMDGTDCSPMHDAMKDGTGHSMMEGAHGHDGMTEGAHGHDGMTDDGSRRGMMTDMMSSMDHGAGSHHEHDHADQMQGMMRMDAMLDTCPMDASGPSGGATRDEPLDADSAVAMAQAWLDAEETGLSTSGVVGFPGYVTVLTADADGAPGGLVSVNVLTGQVWDHAWHGSLIGIDRAS